MHLNVQYFVAHYGLFGIFFTLLLEMIGLPFPGETILALCGIEWSKHVFSLPELVAVAALANVVGSSISYAIGRFLGRSFLLRFGKWIGITQERLERAKAMFQKRETLVILIAKYIAGIRVLIPYLAGISRMSFWKFSLINAISALVWTSVFIVFGNYIGVGWSKYHHVLHQHLVPILIGALLLIGMIAGIKIRMKRKRTFV